MASANPAAAGAPTPSAANITGNGALPGLSRRQILLIIGALMLGMLLAALDQTIVGEVSALHITGVSGSSPREPSARGADSARGRSSSLRSFRTARNKCTRTVASLKPSA